MDARRTNSGPREKLNRIAKGQRYRAIRFGNRWIAVEWWQKDRGDWDPPPGFSGMVLSVRTWTIGPYDRA